MFPINTVSKASLIEKATLRGQIAEKAETKRNKGRIDTQ